MTVPVTQDNTWGAALVGLIMASCLYGITTLQVWIYFANYPDDRKRVKALVVSVWMLDTISLGLVSITIYGYLVTDMYRPLERLKVNRALELDPAIMGILALLTHGYLGHRVWRLWDKSIVMAAILTTLSLTAFALAIASTVVSMRYQYWSEKYHVRDLGLAGTICVVVLDGGIAITLCMYLFKQKAIGTDVRRLVKRVILFALNTGLATSLMAIVNIVTFIALPNNMVFLASNLIFTKIYANTLLANLNARDAIRYNLPFLKQGSLSINLTPIESSASLVGFATPSLIDSHRGTKGSLAELPLPHLSRLPPSPNYEGYSAPSYRHSVA